MNAWKGWLMMIQHLKQSAQSECLRSSSTPLLCQQLPVPSPSCRIRHPWTTVIVHLLNLQEIDCLRWTAAGHCWADPPLLLAKCNLQISFQSHSFRTFMFCYFMPVSHRYPISTWLSHIRPILLANVQHPRSQWQNPTEREANKGAEQQCGQQKITGQHIAMLMQFWNCQLYFCNVENGNDGEDEQQAVGCSGVKAIASLPIARIAQFLCVLADGKSANFTLLSSERWPCIRPPYLIYHQIQVVNQPFACEHWAQLCLFSVQNPFLIRKIFCGWGTVYE